MSDLETFQPILIYVVALTGFVITNLTLAHALGPRRKAAVKDMPYESGMDPVGDARRPFDIKFYIVAILFLVFDVEIIFFYPWAMLYPRFNSAAGTPEATWAAESAASGFGPGFYLASMGLFTLVLLVGFVYEWRKGVFKWD